MRPQLVEPALLDLIVGEPSVAAHDPGTASVINWGLARLRRAHAELLEDFYFNGKVHQGQPHLCPRIMKG
jgi:hypothetical protein